MVRVPLRVTEPRVSLEPQVSGVFPRLAGWIGVIGWIRGPLGPFVLPITRIHPLRRRTSADASERVGVLVMVW